jgi:hypothetical protein
VNITDLDHKTKRRAPAVIGRFTFTITFVGCISYFTGNWDKMDTGVMLGMGLAMVLIYFDPPDVIKTEIYNTPQTWAQRLGKWF